jgi:methylphosphotriester-DNA--protein-cysteine methyltransferase
MRSIFTAVIKFCGAREHSPVRQSGLSSSTNLRARFRGAVGTTPTAYRRTFQHPSTA